jgi:hypothetical protein
MVRRDWVKVSILPYIGDASVEQLIWANALVVERDLERGVTPLAVIRHGVALTNAAARTIHQPFGMTRLIAAILRPLHLAPRLS